MMPIVREHVPLAPITTFGIGGNARYFLETDNPHDTPNLLERGKKSGVEPILMAGASAKDVSGLAWMAKDKVYHRSGIELEEEVTIHNI